jgi:hypothetical protein
MLPCAEMKLIVGMARKEFYGTIYRENYSYRDDASFLFCVKLTLNEEGNVQSQLHPVSETWYPAAALSYRGRYEVIYPREDEARAKSGYNLLGSCLSGPDLISCRSRKVVTMG